MPAGSPQPQPPPQHRAGAFYAGSGSAADQQSVAQSAAVFRTKPNKPGRRSTPDPPPEHAGPRAAGAVRRIPSRTAHRHDHRAARFRRAMRHLRRRRNSAPQNLDLAKGYVSHSVSWQDGAGWGISAGLRMPLAPIFCAILPYAHPTVNSTIVPRRVPD